ncbi:MAG: potassium channel protein [Bacteroidales bacterium]|nr:potassium channel protein [Bacteroidales bacterium]
MKSETKRSIYIALGLLFIIGAVGVAGFMLIEGMSFTQAVYMTVITVATVGFKEVAPLSNTGMWFTSFLIIISFGIFVYAVTNLTRYVIDGVVRNYYRDRKVMRRIERLSDHVIICGYGRNGSQAALDLNYRNVPFIVIENDADIVELLRLSDNVMYIVGDATQDEVLRQAGIEKAKAMITTLPVDADNLYVVLTAREINPGLTIISRASNENSDKKLKRAGATNVIMPDRVGGQRMAKLVTQPDVVEFIDFIMLQEPDNVFLEELSCDVIATCFDGKKIQELDIRNKTGANIIGLKRSDGTYLINPGANTILSNNDKLFALGSANQINHLRKLLAEETNPA